MTKLRIIQQNLQQLSLQKQQFQMRLNELESASKGLVGSEKAYSILGNIMVLRDKKVIEVEIKEQLDFVNLRLQAIDAQEEKLRKKLKDLQNELKE